MRFGLSKSIQIITVVDVCMDMNMDVYMDISVKRRSWASVMLAGLESDRGWGYRRGYHFSKIVWYEIIKENGFRTSKYMTLRSWAKLLIILSEIYEVEEHHGWAGSTLEIDSGHKNKKIRLYPKSVLLFFMDYKKSIKIVRSAKMLSAISLRFDRN